MCVRDKVTYSDVFFLNIRRYCLYVLKKKLYIYIANRTRRTLCCHDRTHEGRIRKTPFQLDMLKSRYAFSPFISHPEAEKLSLVTNLSVWQIKRWFSDRRYDRRSRHHHNRATAAAHVKHEEDNDDTTDRSNSADFNSILNSMFVQRWIFGCRCNKKYRAKINAYEEMRVTMSSLIPRFD